MNKSFVVEFALIFCLITTLVCVVFLVINASQDPVETGAVAIFVVGTVVFAGAAFLLNKRRRELLDQENPGARQ